MAERKKRKPKENEWWVEEHKSRERANPSERQAPAGASFFKTVEDYDQVQAEKNLTDLNAQLLAQADPAPGAWGYVSLLEKKSSQREIDKIKRAMSLPPNLRGAIPENSVRAPEEGALPRPHICLAIPLPQETTFDT